MFIYAQSEIEREGEREMYSIHFKFRLFAAKALTLTLTFIPE